MSSEELILLFLSPSLVYIFHDKNWWVSFEIEFLENDTQLTSIASLHSSKTSYLPNCEYNTVFKFLDREKSQDFRIKHHYQFLYVQMTLWWALCKVTWPLKIYSVAQQQENSANWLNMYDMQQLRRWRRHFSANSVFVSFLESKLREKLSSL